MQNKIEILSMQMRCLSNSTYILHLQCNSDNKTRGLCLWFFYVLIVKCMSKTVSEDNFHYPILLHDNRVYDLMEKVFENFWVHIHCKFFEIDVVLICQLFVENEVAGSFYEVFIRYDWLLLRSIMFRFSVISFR